MQKTIVISILLILVLCSCDVLDLLREQPDVEVKFKDLTPLGLNSNTNTLDLLAKWDVTNKGSATIPRTKIDWKLYLNDYANHFAEGIPEVDTRIEGGETKTLDIPVNIGIQKIIEQGSSIIAGYYLGQRNVKYKIVMKISILNVPLIERSENGTFTLPSGVF